MSKIHRHNLLNNPLETLNEVDVCWILADIIVSVFYTLQLNNEAMRQALLNEFVNHQPESRYGTVSAGMLGVHT